MDILQGSEKKKTAQEYKPQVESKYTVVKRWSVELGLCRPVQEPDRCRKVAGPEPGGV